MNTVNNSSVSILWTVTDGNLFVHDQQRSTPSRNQTKRFFFTHIYIYMYTHPQNPFNVCVKIIKNKYFAWFFLIHFFFLWFLTFKCTILHFLIIYSLVSTKIRFWMIIETFWLWYIIIIIQIPIASTSL